MNNSMRLMVIAAAFIPLAVAVGPASAKGRVVQTKAAGWSLNSGPGSAGSSQNSGGKTKGSSMQDYGGPASAGASMSGMLMTPNGMIAQNTPSMSAGNSSNMGGSSMVGRQSHGVGNSMVDSPARGVGNSQGSGGTLDIAQLTHFGVSSLSSLGSMLGANGSSLSGTLSRFMSSSGSHRSKPANGTPAGGSGKTNNAIKSPAMGMPGKSACVSARGSKSGCG